MALYKGSATTQPLDPLSGHLLYWYDHLFGSSHHHLCPLFDHPVTVVTESA